MSVWSYLFGPAKPRTAYPLSQLPEGYFRPRRPPGAVCHDDEALSLSPVYAALRLYQTTLGKLPLVTYRRLPDGGRERARTHPAYRLLHERPNPAMSRAAFFEFVVRSLFLDGEAFISIRWAGNGSPYGLYPVPRSSVTEVLVDDEWRKAYRVQTADGAEWYADEDMIHILHRSKDGFRGTRLLDWAAESLGLHRQVLESADALFHNAARPVGYLKYPHKLDAQTVANLKDAWQADQGGPGNSGKLAIVHGGADYVPLDTRTVEDSQIIEALGASVADVARWFGVSPLLLGDLSRGTYSNLAADNSAFYQRSLSPLLDKIEQELNAKLFGLDADTYAEFLTEAALRGDPQQVAQIHQTYVQMGVMLRSEVREQLNLPPIPGLDEPLIPLNQGPAAANSMGTPDITTTEGTADAAAPATPAIAG